MLAIFMGLAMLIPANLAGYGTAVAPGQYYEFVVAPQCQDNRTWTIGARYNIDNSGKHGQHLQVRSLPGCVGVKAFIDEAVADHYITVVGR